MVQTRRTANLEKQQNANNAVTGESAAVESDKVKVCIAVSILAATNCMQQSVNVADCSQEEKFL